MLRTAARIPPIALATFLALTASCSAGGDDGPLSPFRRQALRSQLEAARSRWYHNRPLPYRIVQSRDCFCPPELISPIEVTATASPIPESQDEQIIDVRYESDGAAVPSPYRQQVATVAHLFQVIDDAIDRGVARLEVTYDAQYGYPTRIAIDYDAHAADEEITWNLRDLRQGAWTDKGQGHRAKGQGSD